MCPCDMTNCWPTKWVMWENHYRSCLECPDRLLGLHPAKPSRFCFVRFILKLNCLETWYRASAAWICRVPLPESKYKLCLKSLWVKFKKRKRKSNLWLDLVNIHNPHPVSQPGLKGQGGQQTGNQARRHYLQCVGLLLWYLPRLLLWPARKGSRSWRSGGTGGTTST